MNILLCSAGRRCELLKNFKKSLGDNVRVIAADLSPTAPALYFADKAYIVPEISDKNYLNVILDICLNEKIQAVTTLIDPEIEFLADNRPEFEKIGVEVLAPYKETAKLCFNKLEMFKYLRENNIPTVDTYGDIESFTKALNENKIEFPVFVKPRCGSGSVGARTIFDYDTLKEAVKGNPDLIIQRNMGDCVDLDADVYIDTISHKPVSIFSKKKLSTTIGGANKTISFKDERLFEFIKRVLTKFKFNGPIDMDFFYKYGTYYLSEINPRFGGAYLHAYGAGVDFVKLIENNINHIENAEQIGGYDEGIVMMMYDSVVIKRESEMIV